MTDRYLLEEAIIEVLRESSVVLSTAQIVEGVKSLIVAAPKPYTVVETLRDLESEGWLESYWGPKGAPKSQAGRSLF